MTFVWMTKTEFLLLLYGCKRGFETRMNNKMLLAYMRKFSLTAKPATLVTRSPDSTT